MKPEPAPQPSETPASPQRSLIKIKSVASPVSLGPEPPVPRPVQLSYVQRLFLGNGLERHQPASKALSQKDQQKLSDRMLQFVISAKMQRSVVCSLIVAKSGQVDEHVNFQFQAADLAFPPSLPALIVENAAENEHLVIGGSAAYPEATIWQATGDKVRCQQVTLLE